MGLGRLERHKELALTLNDIYKSKNSDYGDAFGESCDEFGPVAGLIRMNDKMNRLKSLINDGNEQKVSDESVRDTLLDLANYSLMLEVWFEGKRPHEDDDPVAHVKVAPEPIGQPKDVIGNVLSCTRQGMSVPQIAALLGISSDTVDHIQRVKSI